MRLSMPRSAQCPAADLRHRLGLLAWLTRLQSLLLSCAVCASTLVSTSRRSAQFAQRRPAAETSLRPVHLPRRGEREGGVSSELCRQGAASFPAMGVREGADSFRPSSARGTTRSPLCASPSPHYSTSHHHLQPRCGDRGFTCGTAQSLGFEHSSSLQPPRPIMPLLNLRELLQFPGGDNATDTVINGIHFNLSALEYFNYTIYDNGTISNSSRCYLIFDHHRPVMMSNGSWVNGTSCYFPYYSIRTRGAIGIAYAALFGASIMFTLINLRKHGRLFLREDKRFRVIGRRWQWYWMCFVAACGMISTITSVDVDRNYLQSLPIILQSFFFTLMLPGTLAMVWEAVRHWLVCAPLNRTTPN